MKNIDEIRLENKKIVRYTGTVQELDLINLIRDYNGLNELLTINYNDNLEETQTLQKEIDRKEKILTNTQGILDRIGDRVFDYYK